MSILQTRIDPASEDFKANAAAMQALVDDLTAVSARLALGGSQLARDRHRARGKWLARERIDALLDPGSAFVEIAPLAACGMSCMTMKSPAQDWSRASGGLQTWSA